MFFKSKSFKNLCLILPTFSDTFSISMPQLSFLFKMIKLYKIESLGDTDFTLIGSSVNAVGAYFWATGSGIGTGTASRLNYENEEITDIVTKIEHAIEQHKSYLKVLSPKEAEEYIKEEVELDKQRTFWKS